MANVKISELNINSSPSTSATLVGVDNGETVQISISNFVTKDESGDIVAHYVTVEDGIDCTGGILVREGYNTTFYSEDESKRVSLWCDDNGKLSLDGKTVATVDDIPSGGSGSSNSIPFTYFTCYSNERTVRELLDQLTNEGLDTTNSITVIVTFSAMLSGTFLCDISHYYGDYYGCKFTDLTNLKTYYFEGESRSLSLYDNLSNGGSSNGGGIIDVTEFPSNPSTTSIYRKWQVVKAEWVFNGNIATDGGMVCEVVNTLPETGEVCYTGSTMYSYYQRADGECYGYVDSNLSAMMSVPAGWYPAATLFGALGFAYNGMIDSLAEATTGYSLLLTKKPHLYHYYDDSKGNIVKSAIITNDNYEFDENLGTLTQVIVL